MDVEEFWQFYIDDFKACFPHLPDDLDVDTLHRAVNTVQPSLIRVESDEATYNLHIMVRYEIEKELVNGEINVSDYRMFGIRKWKNIWVLRHLMILKVLQDIHWSMVQLDTPTYT